MAVVVPRPPKRYTYWKQALASDAALADSVTTVSESVSLRTPGLEQRAAQTLRILLNAATRLVAAKGTAPSAAWGKVNLAYHRLAAGTFGNAEYNADADAFVLNPEGLRFAAAVYQKAVEVAEAASRLGASAPGSAPARQAQRPSAPSAAPVSAPPAAKGKSKAPLVLGLIALVGGGLYLSGRGGY